MKDLEKNNLEDFEIPEQFYNNLMPDEKILYKFKSIKPSIFDKIFIFMIIGMIIFIGIMEIRSVIRRGIGALFDFFSLMTFLVFFPMIFFMFFIMRKKMKFTKEYYVIITNTRIYTLESVAQEEYMNIIELNSIKLINLRKRKQSEKIGDVGIIDIFTETVGPEKNHRLSIKGVQNVKLTLDIIESIIYHYGNAQERLDSFKNQNKISIPYDFKLDEEVFEKISKSYKISSILTVFSIIGLIIGVFFYIYFLIYSDLFLDFYMIFMFAVAFGLMLLLYSPIRMYYLKKVRTSDKNCILRIKKEEIILEKELLSLSIQFNNNLYLNLSCTNYPSRSKPKKFVGGIKIKQSYETLEEIKFGPLFEYLDLIEFIFLYIIHWKSQSGYLKTIEQLLKSIKEEPKRIPYVKEKDKIEPYTITEKVEEISFESYDQTDEIFKPIIHYLNPNERILLAYKPEIKIIKYIFFIIIGIFCLIMIFVMFSLIGVLPFSLFVPIFMLIMLGMIFGMIFICFLPGVLMMKKSMYVFTNQKIIAKYSKKYLITPYNNISSIMKKDRKKTYNIDINLKSEIESSPLINKSTIFIQNVPKGNDLLLKIKKIKDSVLISK